MTRAQRLLAVGVGAALVVYMLRRVQAARLDLSPGDSQPPAPPDQCAGKTYYRDADGVLNICIK